jgi:hypothetical protein
MREPLPSEYAFLFAEFERDGEDTIRERVAMKRYEPVRHGLAVLWLRSKDQTRLDAAEERREDVRLEERRKDRKTAIIAVIIAAIVGIIAVMAWLHPMKPS